MLTEVSVDQLAVVDLSSHGSDLLQLGLLRLHSLLQPLQLLGFGLNTSEEEETRAKRPFSFSATFSAFNVKKPPKKQKIVFS